MSKHAWSAVVAAVWLAGCTCAAEPPADWPRVNVVSFAPDGSTFEDLPSIEVMFDAPVAAEAEVGQPIDASRIEIDPAVEIHATWRDRQTLVVRPTRALAAGTRYTVALASTFPVVVPEGQRSHSFVHAPLSALGISGADDAWFAPQAEFGIRFNLPVVAGDVAAHCALTTAETPVALTATAPETVASVVMVRPSQALTPGADYDLSCPDLVASGGNAPIQAPLVASVHVYPAAAIAEVVPAGSEPVTPDELEIVVRTATPTPIEEIRRHVHIEPAVAGFAARWVARNETTFQQTVSLDASAEYTITADVALADRFGQRLAQPFRRHLTTTDARPRVHMETGIYAVEAQSAGYPVWSRNVRRIDVQCAFVPAARIPEILTTTMDYDPWYADGPHEAGWVEHGLTPVTFQIDHADAQNRWRTDDVDFTTRCASSAAGRSAAAGRRGVYLAEVRSPDVERDRSDDGGGGWYRYPYRVLANVTDLGVLMQAGPTSGLVWVTRISDGAPVASATVSVYDPQGTRVHRGRTDADGVARLPGSRRLLHQDTPAEQQDEEEEDDGGYEYDDYDDMDSYRAQRMIVVVESGGDVAALDGNWSNGIQLYNFGVPRDTATGGETAIRGFILSDRGIYRPGEQVHFKGFVRELPSGGTPRVPRARAIAVTIEDAHGTPLFDRSMRITPYGGFSLTYALEEDSPTGDYYVRATVAGHTFRERFSVEEFRPVAFEVTERAGGATAPGPGEDISLGYSASYLFGAPLAHAPYTWSVSRRRRFLRFSEYPSYTFDDWSSLSSEYFWSRYSTPSESWVTDGRGQTDDEGAIAIRYRDRATSLRGPQDYLVDVRVTDPTDQTISKRSVVTVHPTDLYLGLFTQEYVQAVGMPFAVHAVAVTPDGRRVATAATLTLTRRRNDCTRQGGDHGWMDCHRSEEAVWTRQLQLREGGVTIERIEAEHPGEYTIRLAGRDRAGRDVAASSMAWVIGEGEAFWSGDESVRMSLIASRDRYDVGDVARLVPQAQLAGATALVALERDGVLSTRVVRMGSGVSAIEVPIEAAHAPNVFVSVAAVRGRTGPSDEQRPTFRMGVANLEVSPAARRLDVEIATEREDYRPGDTVTGTVRVTSGGQPVQAELSLSVADEGVLQLVNYRTPDPLRAFYRPWSLGVEASTSWNRIARSRPPLNWEEGEDGSDDAGEGSDPVRSRFVSSAFWAPALVTDAQGSAAFTFVAPDNLTSFRLMAAAADRADRFGSGERRIRVRKELMIAPILPRFFGEGDRMQIGVTVHNETDAAADVRVTAVTRGVTIPEAQRERTVRVAAHGVERVLFPARVGGARSDGQVRFDAHMTSGSTEHTDALERTLPIRSPQVIEPRAILVGSSDAATSADSELAFGEPTIARASHLEITIDRTGLAALAPSLRHLVEYPYGGLEQTISTLLPLFATRDLATSLRIPTIRDDRRLRVFTRQAVARVVRHQHGDGLFSFWPSTEGSAPLSAYAMFGLTQASGNGGVRRSVIDSGLHALQTWANGSSRRIEPGGDAPAMAMIAYVLASQERTDQGLNARLYESRAALGPDGRAFLLRALVRGQAPAEPIETLASELEALAETDGDRATIPEPSRYWNRSSVRSTAIVLSALLEARPESPLVPRLVRGLLAARDERGIWRTTQEDAYSLLALAEYARTRDGGSTRVTVRLGDTELYSDAIEGTEIVRIDRTLAQVRPGRLHIESDGPLTYTARVVLARPATEADAASHGFALRREYVDFQTHQPVDEVTVGQLVTVRLTVASEGEHDHVALADELPAGFEVVNTALATEQLGASAESRLERQYGWQHIELRDEGARAFAPHLSARERTFEYVVRATTEGTFTAPGARIEALYDPDAYARTASASIEVRR